MIQKILRYGLIGGAIVCIGMVGTIFMMKNMDEMGTMSMVYGFGTMILAFSSIFFAIRAYRNEQGGVITFGKSFLIGLGITIVASTMYTLTWLIYVNTLGKGFEEKYAAAMQVKMEKDSTATITKMIADGKPDAEIEVKMKAITKEREDGKKMMELYQNNTLVKAAITYTEIVPVGLIMSLVMAIAFMFMKKPETQAGVD